MALICAYFELDGPGYQIPLISARRLGIPYELKQYTSFFVTRLTVPTAQNIVIEKVQNFFSFWFALPRCKVVLCLGASTSYPNTTTYYIDSYDLPLAR